MQVVLLGGFLGSGKTTLLNKLAEHLIKERNIAANKVIILENEIGEIGIDDQLLKSSGYQVQITASGCFCCSMSGDLLENLLILRKDYDPQYVIIEATGVAYPYKIKEMIEESSLQLKCITCCLVDAKRWKRLFIPLHQFLVDQLDRTSVVIINKIDLVDESTLQEVIDSVKQYSGDAELFLINAHESIETELIDKLFLIEV